MAARPSSAAYEGVMRIRKLSRRPTRRWPRGEPFPV
jgi:hypothetical protein